MSPSVQWTDDHCHLPADLREARAVVREAHGAGVNRLINVGTDVAGSFDALMVARGNHGVWATAGVHPHDAKTVFDAGSGTVDLSPIEVLLPEPEVVAVGECGLDYHYDHSPRDQQRDVFAAQVALASAHDLALVIHTREAWEDTFAILREVGTPERTVLHCFTGGPTEVRRVLDLGMYVSFSGIVTYKNAPEVRDAAALCPLDRLLVETDAPFLAPVPHRGTPNSPALVPLVGAMIAQVKDIEVADVASASWENAERVYALH